MISGAYAVSMIFTSDVRLGIVPIVPPRGSGDIKFERVVVSFATDLLSPLDDPRSSGGFDFIAARMRIWTNQGTLRYDTGRDFYSLIRIDRGRTAVFELEPGDVAVSVSLPWVSDSDIFPVTALVEYETL